MTTRIKISVEEQHNVIPVEVICEQTKRVVATLQKGAGDGGPFSESVELVVHANQSYLLREFPTGNA